MESSGLAIDIWTVVQTCWNLPRLCGFIWLFLIHVNYYGFHSFNPRSTGLFAPGGATGVFSNPSVKLDPETQESWNFQGW